MPNLPPGCPSDGAGMSLNHTTWVLPLLSPGPWLQVLQSFLMAGPFLLTKPFEATTKVWAFRPSKGGSSRVVLDTIYNAMYIIFLRHLNSCIGTLHAKTQCLARVLTSLVRLDHIWCRASRDWVIGLHSPQSCCTNREPGHQYSIYIYIYVAQPPLASGNGFHHGCRATPWYPSRSDLWFGRAG